ncbi:MAG TPA: LysR substrate-binding domain-containing protein [Alphaproteobacteria bacterium]|jgi:LysR family hydrogen peroxide-inducible transcriptional activator|nr:LysR substrate-binding domain-containing protein [Alphaproteobacteria bacterium]
MPAPEGLSLRQLGYLVAISETLNFTEAANRCHVTQSTLSGGLKELERFLGATLVERDRRRVLMTPLGNAAVARARDLLTSAGDLVTFVGERAKPMAGTLRLGAIPTVAPFLLPPLLRTARQRYPELQIVLREEQTARLLAEVEDGRLDFALMALPYDTGRLRVRSLFAEDLWLIAPLGDPLAGTAPLPLADVATDRLLLLEEGHCLREHTLEACGTARSNPESTIEATSLPTLVQMVESKLGVALLPEIVIKGGALAGALVEPRPLRRPAPQRTIALVARPTTGREQEFDALAVLAIEAGTRIGGKSTIAAPLSKT